MTLRCRKKLEKLKVERNELHLYPHTDIRKADRDKGKNLSCAENDFM